MNVSVMPSARSMDPGLIETPKHFWIAARQRLLHLRTASN
jgi:hypothetical protein